MTTKSMEQKEQEWSTWWASRLYVNDGTLSVWAEEQAILREKKNWWFYTFGERYWTREDKEQQWRDYWEATHGEDSEPFDGNEKKLWWRKTFGEEYVKLN